MENDIKRTELSRAWSLEPLVKDFKTAGLAAWTVKTTKTKVPKEWGVEYLWFFILKVETVHFDLRYSDVYFLLRDAL